jgi:hypothetical protein
VRDKLSAEDVLRDIEFELAQALVSHGDLAQGVHAVRRYHNEACGEMLRGSRSIESVDRVIRRLFQINDMLITLLHEAASAIQSLRIDLRRMTELARDSASAGGTGEAPLSTVGADRVGYGPGRGPTSEQLLGESDRHRLAELESAMQPEALKLRVVARPVRIPIIGGLLRRLREVFHNLVLFYVKRLADRQTIVNQTYGDSILQLTQMNQRQQEQIDMLRKRLAVLQARLAEVEVDGE